jgi:hypothetical protein
MNAYTLYILSYIAILWIWNWPQQTIIQVSHLPVICFIGKVREDEIKTIGKVGINREDNTPLSQCEGRKATCHWQGDHQQHRHVIQLCTWYYNCWEIQIVCLQKCMNVSRKLHISKNTRVIQNILLVLLWTMESSDKSFWAGVELGMWSMARLLWETMI